MNRSMAGPTSTSLSYELDSDPGHTTNWGNIIGTDVVAGTGNGNSQTLTVYGQVHAGQYYTPGTYTDTITASVIY
jgi:spore coat protein U-like protein